MRYILILGILLINGAKSYAHTDRYFTYNFDNVTVRFKTGFLFEEINNAKIIGHYAALLCNELRYNKPVLLDFIHDYGNSYKGKNYSFINVGSEVYNSVSYYSAAYDSIIEDSVYQMVSYSKIDEQDLSKLEKIIRSTEPIDTLEKVIIRQFGFHFKVNNTLKLLHYTISNPDEIIESTKKDTLLSYLPNMYYELNTIPKCKIDSIKALKIETVEKIIEQKVYAKPDTANRSQLPYSYFAKNNCYTIFENIQDNETILDTLNQVYSIKINNDYGQSLFVFETPNRFKRYNKLGFDNAFKKSKLHEIPIDKDNFLVFFNVNWVTNDIFFIELHNIFEMSAHKIFLYLLNEDVLITDFESYIKSHRNE